MYAFFRARTLGYDVYPEDYFLRNFPWQQYGGLWIVNEARFARAEPLKALTAQALRRITGVGASLHSGDSRSPTNHFTNSSYGHQPARLADPRHNLYNHPAAIAAFDGSVCSFSPRSDRGNNQPVFNMGSVSTTLLQPEALRPNLTLLTDVSRRYPGFPSPLSPTLSAKELYPTPTSDCESSAATPHIQSATVRSTSPMSIDGSNISGASTRCISHSYGHFAEQMGNIDSILACPSQTCSTSRRTSTTLVSPTSAQRALSPRVGMLRHMATAQALRGLHRPGNVPGHGPHSSPIVRNVRRDSVISNNSLSSILYSPSTSSLSLGSIWGRGALPAPPSIQIANGTEFETGSPISPTGTMLSYTSNRAVDSGLLAVPALGEPQVAEYRFWVPCGRRVCAFGCGGVHEGENSAAKKLFKDAESVLESKVAERGYELGGGESSFEDVRADVSKQQPHCKYSSASSTKPADEWEKFLKNKERDVSVARV